MNIIQYISLKALGIVSGLENKILMLDISDMPLS